MVSCCGKMLKKKLVFRGVPFPIITWPQVLVPLNSRPVAYYSTFWHAIPTSLFIFNDFFFLVSAPFLVMFTVLFFNHNPIPWNNTDSWVILQVKAKIYSRTDIISDRRFQRYKHGNNCARSWQQQDMLTVISWKIKAQPTVCLVQDTAYRTVHSYIFKYKVGDFGLVMLVCVCAFVMQCTCNCATLHVQYPHG